MVKELNSTFSKQAGISSRKIFYLLAFAGFFGTLFLILFSGTTKAPELVSPRDYIVLRGYEGQDVPLSIKWNHGGIIKEKQEGGFSRLFPSRATRFVVCVYEKRLAGFCSGDGTDVLFVSEEATAIPRTRLGAPNSLVYSLVERLYPYYEYTYDVVLPASVLDNRFNWTVYACSGGTQLENCTRARQHERELSVSNRNLVAFDIEESSYSTGIIFWVVPKNEGDTTGEPYTSVFKAWEILYDSSEVRPLLNVMDTAADDAQTVITTDGEEAPISSFRNGNRSDLFAIKRPRGASVVWYVNYPTVPSPNATVPQSVRPCDLPNAGDCFIPRPANSPSLFAVFYKIDPDNHLIEFNETDNVLKSNSIR